jgi:hypothetical protein
MRLRDFAPVCCALASITVLNRAHAHDLLRTIDNLGGAYLDWASATRLDDLDGDGIDELAIVRPLDWFQTTNDVRILSGASGSVLRTIPIQGCCLAPESLGLIEDLDGDGLSDLIVQGSVYSPATGSLLLVTSGQLACSIGDVDADGVSDLAISTPEFFAPDGLSIPNGAGYVEVVSGATGITRWHIAGDNTAEGFGGLIAPAGDFDGDGRGDVLATTNRYTLGSHPANYVRILSGRNGAQLFHAALPNPSSIDFQGYPRNGAARALRDIDGDGTTDIVVGEPTWRRARAISGATGATLWTRTIPPHALGADGLYFYGETVATVFDVDGDGVRDVMVGARQPSIPGGGCCNPPMHYGTGFCELLSGSTGNLLHVFVGSRRDSQFGSFAKAIGDLDGDGVAEIAIGSMAGGLRIFSGRAGYSAPANECEGFTPQGAQVPLTIGWTGSTSAGAANFALTIAHAYPGGSGRFAFAPFAASELFRYVTSAPSTSLSCLQGHVAPVGVPFAVGSDGSAVQRVRLGASGSPFAVGTTWHFQFAQMHNGRMATSDALALTVTP